MIPHNKPTIGDEEESAALRVLRSGQLAQDIEVEEFENEFCKFVGLPRGHSVAVSSGTASLYLALLTLKASGKDIVFPGYVCSAIRNAVDMIGGNEQIVDVSSDSPNIDIGKIGQDKFAIIPHMYGIPVDLSEHKNFHVIEDCAQALGAKVKGISVGLHGDVGIFSFYVTKLITTGGQGGMVISKNKEYIEMIKDYREFDSRHDTKKRFNFQMTDLQAAIGREQLKKLPGFLKRREEIFQKYKKAGLDLLDVRTQDLHISPVRYRAVMKTNHPHKIIDALRDIGVRSIIPTEEWEIMGSQESLPKSIELAKQTVSLPIYPTLSDSDVDAILSVII